MQKSKPLLSVCMVTYNHEHFIAQSIEGVLMQQTSFTIELIIGEDCSTDNTRKVCLEYQQKYPDIIRLILPEKNLGVMNNFMGILKSCQGKYIALCDGDDYWTDPLKLQKQVDFLETHPGYAVTYHDAYIVDQNNQKVGESRLTAEQKRDFTQEELGRARVNLLTLSMCFRNVIERFPASFAKAINGDMILISFLGNYGRGHYMPEILPAAFRTHGGGVWSLVPNHVRARNSRISLGVLENYYSETGNAVLRSHFNACKLHDTKSYLYESVHDKSTKDVFKASAYMINDNNLYTQPKAFLAVVKTLIKYLFS